MDIFETMLLIGCFIAAAACRFELRAVIWIGVGIADYIITSLYYSLGLPYHAFLTAMVDSAVVLCIYFFAAYQWELWLWRAFQLSVACSILRLAGLIPDAFAYALLLEVCNWLALFVMFGKGIAATVGHGNIAHSYFSHGFYRAVRSLRATRKEAPFHKARR